MTHIRKEIVVKNKQGLHARPAAMFIQIVSKYNANVVLQKDKERVNGRSLALYLFVKQHWHYILKQSE